jgi:hypothetical protein
LRELWATLGLGRVKSLLGHAARKEAEEWTRRSLALAEEIGSRWGVAAASVAAAELAAERRDRRASRELCQRALNVAQEMGLVRLARRAEGLLAAERGESARASSGG